LPGVPDKINIPQTSVPKSELLKAMLEPRFYPKPASEIIHRETHISHLFFAGDLVYKIKKPVRYPFLDYSTLSKRRHFLEAELQLNRRLAPSVYLGVMPITQEGLGWRLGGEGPPEEYALVMRRLPAKRMLSFLIETHQVTEKMAWQLAEFIAKFHCQAERAEELEPQQHLRNVTKQWDENLGELKAFAERAIGSDACAAIESYGSRFLTNQRELIMRRAAGGWVRELHGDLHCDHVCFAPEGIQIFDCIEFNPELRSCDVASEIAFLIMDAEVRGDAGWVRPFLNRYFQLLDGDELPPLLPFYKCYRALVRGKVHALRSHTGQEDAVRYLEYAARLTWAPYKPFLVLISGLTGGGKSTLARELGASLGLPVVNTDVVRKAMAGISERQVAAFNAGLYSPEMTDKTYARMAKVAESLIVKGEGAIVDGTFGQKKHRGLMLRIAAKHNTPLFVIWCYAPENVVKERLAHRTTMGVDPSDGSWEIFQLQKTTYQAMDEIPAAMRLDLDTQTTTKDLVHECERFLRERLNPHAQTV